MFDVAKKYQDSGFRTRWDQYFKVYSGQRVIRNYEGIADPVIRESHTIIETLVANIASGEPTFSFVQTNEEQSKDTEVLNGMLDYDMKKNQMGLVTQEWVREMLLYGTATLHISWRDGRPCVENIPIRDFFVDPTATKLENARYAGHVYLIDKEVLKSEMIYDDEKNEMVARYMNLEKIGFDKDNKESGTGGNGDNSSTDKAFKDAFAGSTLGDKAMERQVYVIRLYDILTGYVYEVGNRKEFIYKKPTWCQREEITEKVNVEVDGQIVEVERKLDEIKPFLPYAVLRDYIDTSQFYGTGEMALLIGDAELLNDYEAMDVDNNAYQNTPMYWVDPQFADLIPEIETISGAVYPIPRNAMGALERPQLSADLDLKKQRILERMRRATAADEAVQGVSQQKSRTTATEIGSQLAQARTRYSTKITNFGSEGYAQLATVFIKFYQIFRTTRTSVRIVGKMGAFFKDYDPWEYNGEWEPHVELQSEIDQKKQEVGMRMNQVFQLFVNDPNFNQVELKRWMAQFVDPELTDDKFNAMLAPPQEPKDDTQDFVNVSYKDLEPHARYQWQKNVGWEPDPSLLGDMQNRMLHQAVEGADLMDPATTEQGNVVPGMEQALQPATSPEGMTNPTPAAMPA